MFSTSVLLALIGVCVAATMTPSMALTMTMSPPKNQNDTIYSIYVPNQIRPGIALVINVQLMHSPNPIKVSVKFESIDHQFTLRKTSLVHTGSIVKLPIGMLPLDYNGVTQFNLTISGIDYVTNKRVFVHYTDSFIFDSKSVSILIETDKSIYQPKQAIKFRAICMTPDLRPLTGNVTYQVEDPKGNIVLLSRSVPLRKGVAGGHLTLSRRAMEGEWIIKFKYNGREESAPVTVSTYKLPKFEVKLTVPKFFYPDSEGITVTVKAKYTYGAPVFGKMRLVIGSNRQNLKINRDNFKGEMDLFIPRKQIMTELRLDERSEYEIKIDGFVTETLTSITHKSSAEMEYKQSKILIDVLSKPQVVKPGLHYQALVKVSDRRWGILREEDRLKNNLVVIAKYNYQPLRSIKSRPLMFVYEVPHNGIVTIDLETRNDSFKSISFRVCTNETATKYPYSHQWTASKALSPSNSFIQILPTEDAAIGEVVVGKLAKFVVNTNKPVKEIQFMAVSRGSVLLCRTVSRMDEESMMSNFSFNVTSHMTPSVTVIASYFTEQNEIVADSIKINVDLSLANMMVLNTSKKSVDAGTDISIIINSTAAHAYVGLRAVDRSVLLLKSGNDISKQRVFSELEQYSGIKHTSNSVFRFSQALHSKVFENAGIIVLSNAWFYTPPMPSKDCNSQSFQARGFVGPQMMNLGIDVDLDEQGVPEFQAKSVATSGKVRKLFPETWLWASGETSEEGIAEFNATAPDTITSWEISAFSISEMLGLGIADVQKLTVFRKFFVSLNLPLKIVRGEIIVVQANIFNNYDSDLTARIELNIPRKYTGVTLMRPGNDGTINGPIRSVLIPSKGFATVKFPLKMNTLGEVPIQIMASSPLAVDTVERRVYIKPEGIQQCYSSSVLIRKTIEKQQQDELLIKIPKEAVNGSARATVNIYGDILGSTISNLGKLLKAPSGCGEQNMLSFSPDIFVTLYLRNIGKLSKETKEKAYQHIIDGYMNQLRYKRVDGSFSAFGDRDAYGSTWLTAFVTHCFLYARELKEELIEKSVVEDAVRFLLRQQKQDGSFEEKGQVIHQDMQGGVNSPTTMTAYVLITLSKLQSVYTSADNTRLNGAIRKARVYLERSISTIQSDAYALSLVSYALTLAESRFAKEVGQNLDALAIRTPSGYKFWNRGTEQPSTYLSTTSPSDVQATPYQIEATAYALLRLARNKATNKALPVLKWIVSKQNELGGYSSTQDTVIAVQALAKVALLFNSNQEQDLSIALTHSKDDAFVHELSIREENSVVYNSVEVTPLNGMVNVTSQGLGIAVAQLSVCYNTPTTPYDHEPFTCHNVRLEKEDRVSSKLSMKYCCSLDKKRDPTGMFLFEVDLLNGYTVDVLQEEQRNPMAKLIELSQKSVNLYYDQLYPGETQCINLQLIKVADVGELQPATIKAFEYYKPEKAVYRMYNLEELSKKGPCDTCGYECVGCPAPVLSAWKQWTDCVEFCLPENSTRVKDCIDPSLKTKIDMFRCGVETPPTETKSCQKDFSCPDVSDGLWYEMPSGYQYWNHRSHLCRVMGQWRSPWTVIPGTTLNGKYSYIRCNINLPGFVPTKGEREQALEFTPIDLGRENSLPKQALTISFLIKLNFYERLLTTTLFSIGKIGEVPLIKLEKPILGRNWTFSAALGNKRDRVENIPLSAIPLGKWSHVIAMWDLEKGCKILVNGVEVGQSTSYTVRHKRPMPSDIELNFGRSTMSNTRAQGLVSGSYSDLHLWSKRITNEEVKGLSKFHQEVIQFSGPEPLLSARHLRDFASVPTKKCFNKPAFLSMIYAKDAICE